MEFIEALAQKVSFFFSEVVLSEMSIERYYSSLAYIVKESNINLHC